VQQPIAALNILMDALARASGGGGTSSTITRGALKSGEKTVRVQAKFPVKWKEYGMPWNGAFYAPEIKEVRPVMVESISAQPRRRRFKIIKPDRE
jgi:hypothetical protein